MTCSFKVRSLWSAIDGMLSSTSEEQRDVESVLKGEVDQNVLDGKDRFLRIPRILLERVEQLPHPVRLRTKFSIEDTGRGFGPNVSICFSFFLAEFRKRIWSRSAEPADSTGADQSSTATAKRGALQGPYWSQTCPWPRPPAGQMSTVGSLSSEAPPREVQISRNTCRNDFVVMQ